MSLHQKKIMFTILDIIITLIVDFLSLQLTITYYITVTGSTAPSTIEKKILFFPIVALGIIILFTVITFLIYYKFRKKQIISKKYLILVGFNVLPLWWLSDGLVDTMMEYRDLWDSIMK